MKADLRPILVGLVPRSWSPEQALNAVNLLQQATASIWYVHGQAMGRAMLDQVPRDAPPAAPAPSQRTDPPAPTSPPPRRFAGR